jgi:hypothetical protein
MSLHVLHPLPDTFRNARLAVGKALGICAQFCVNEVFAGSRATIKVLDRILRHILGIREFSREPGCVLRYSEDRARTTVILPNGEAVQPGDLILELHFWNDRLGRDLNQRTSPRPLRSALRRSLVLLAEQLQSNKNFANVRAVHATLARLPSRSCRINHPFGCTLRTEPRSNKRRLHDCLENLLIHSLRWTFNPWNVKQTSLRLNRIELWISVSELQARFCGVAHPVITNASPLEKLRPPSKFPRRETNAVEAAGD